MKRIFIAVVGIAIMAACEDKSVAEQTEKPSTEQSQTEQSRETTEPKSEVDPIVGEWKLTTTGKVVEEAIVNVKPHSDGPIYTFRDNNKGWVYREEGFQESFTWAWVEENKIEISDWTLETPDTVIVEPLDYLVETTWTVRELTADKLILSFGMTPDPFWYDGQELPPPYTLALGFTKQ